MKIAVLSDPHIGSSNPVFVPNWNKAVAAVNARDDLDLAVVLGDLTLYGSEKAEDLPFGARALEALRLTYFRALTEMVEGLKPDVVAHMDLVRKFEPEGFTFSQRVMSEIDRALEAIRSYGGILDINCAAFRNGYGPVYPLPQVLERAHRMGVRVTLGDDSHGVDTVGVSLAKSVQAAANAGYDSIAYLTRADGWRDAPLGQIAPITGGASQ